MTHPLFVFTFKQQVHGNKHRPCTYLRHKITAETHADAFKTWCRMPSIQALSVEELGILRVEITPAAPAQYDLDDLEL
jgi:hypothetical protein